MQMIAVGSDGSVTVKLTAEEARKVRDDLHTAGQPWDASYTLARHIAMIHGDPKETTR
jgi:hypothetical protein